MFSNSIPSFSSSLMIFHSPPDSHLPLEFTARCINKSILYTTVMFWEACLWERNRENTEGDDKDVPARPSLSDYFSILDSLLVCCSYLWNCVRYTLHFRKYSCWLQITGYIWSGWNPALKQETRTARKNKRVRLTFNWKVTEEASRLLGIRKSRFENHLCWGVFVRP